MKPHLKLLISLPLILLFIAVQLLPTVTWAQYNRAKKNTGYLLPRPQVVSAIHISDEVEGSQIHEGKNALNYLNHVVINSSEAGMSSMFRRNLKPSTASIERAILYQRSLKQKLDLSFLATMGYSLFSHGQLYMPQNDVTKPR
jgi:hypothetical protein